MSIEWLDYKGNKILYANYQGLMNDVESLKQLSQQMAIIAEAKEPLLLLVNLSDTRMSPDTAQYTKEQLARLNTKLKRIALVGVSGLKTIIVQGIGRETGETPQGMFATLDEAKDWLVR